MAQTEHVEVARGGASAVQKWRAHNFASRLDLRGADLRAFDLSGANLAEAHLRGANLARAKLAGTRLIEADLRSAGLQDADLRGADLTGASLDTADLRGANLSQAVLRSARLIRADLSGANLDRADLRFAHLVETNLERATLTRCEIYGAAAWNLRLTGAVQAELVVTAPGEVRITADNVEVAQLVHLLLSNPKVGRMIDAFTSKVVLILGRFTADQKPVLDELREELRRHDLLPVLFDFEKPNSRDLTETVATLAHMSQFVIADITDARCIPQELHAIVPTLPSVPVVPLLERGSTKYAMFDYFRRFPWVLEECVYDRPPGTARLNFRPLVEQIIGLARSKVKELREAGGQRPSTT